MQSATSGSASVYRFREYELDERRLELRRGGEQIALQPRVLSTILYFAKNQGRLVTKQELLSGPWGGTIVSGGAISRVVREIRRALGDNAKRPRILVTVRGVGYRFEPPALG
ncbi:MAG TPA: winged helix-turn-helix domain-containing protein [Polyangiaceae bacterium]|nr:winged helix-turn-helix domain-containing protein [Polyangiaceae bacterium]